MQHDGDVGIGLVIDAQIHGDVADAAVVTSDKYAEV